MNDTLPSDFTVRLNRLAAGDPSAIADVQSILYDELRKLAASHMARQRADHTLGVPGLLNEAWIRLNGNAATSWASRKHFYCTAAKVMRSVLVDHARAKGRQKRAKRSTVPLDDEQISAPQVDHFDALDVDDALERLKQRDEQLAQIVELRFFGGLSHAEIAEVQDVCVRTVERGWCTARAWLCRELGSADASGR